jgi:hypothetical protein
MNSKTCVDLKDKERRESRVIIITASHILFCENPTSSKGVLQISISAWHPRDQDKGSFLRQRANFLKVKWFPCVWGVLFRGQYLGLPLGLSKSSSCQRYFKHMLWLIIQQTSHHGFRYLPILSSRQT